MLEIYQLLTKNRILRKEKNESCVVFPTPRPLGVISPRQPVNSPLRDMKYAAALHTVYDRYDF